MAAAPKAADGVEAVRIRAPRLFELGGIECRPLGPGLDIGEKRAQTLCGGAPERAVAWIVCIVFLLLPHGLATMR
jgi:hypothetical protein